MRHESTHTLKHDLFLPIVLFASLGAMTWAVRGCSGFGATAGCAFAGVGWGTAWWYIAREKGPIQSRRYASAWIILAMTIGMGMAGARGWAQWWPFFEGRLQTNASTGEFMPIEPIYGFVWTFIAGVPWAGLGACLLAWCGPVRPMRWWQWPIRIAFGVGAVYLARAFFDHYPNYCLPLYSEIEARYKDLGSNPNLRRLMNDNRAAISHLGLYLGFLAFEMFRRDWKNVVLIVTVGLLNGIGWAALQNWTWAERVWPGVEFNWWRCWESSGGISIGFAYGVAYYLVNRPVSERERASLGTLLTNHRPNLERFALMSGLIFGLTYATRNGLKGWANIYLGNEDYWAAQLSKYMYPPMWVAIGAAALWVFFRPKPRDYDQDLFPRDRGAMLFVLVVLNIIAQLVTGHSDRNEIIFTIYYVILFAVTVAAVLYSARSKSKYREITTENQ